MTTIDHRAAAQDCLNLFIQSVETQPDGPARTALLDECRALTRAITAFHMEGIRFRMFNVDRLLARSGFQVSDEATRAFAEARRHLEAAGFHTRSHQAPG